MTQAEELIEMSAEGLMSVRELARFLCLSEGGIRQMVHRGEIPHVKIGRRVLFDPKDIAVWIEERKQYPLNFKGGNGHGKKRHYKH